MLQPPMVGGIEPIRGRGPGGSIRGMASVVTPLLAEWRMENLDEGMGNGSSPEFHGRSRVVSMGGSGFAHPHFRMVAERVGATAVAPGSKVFRVMDGLPGTGCQEFCILEFLAVLFPYQGLTGGFPPAKPRISGNLDRDIKVLNFAIILGSNVMLIRAGIGL